jgi:hypothetical protein
MLAMFGIGPVEILAIIVGVVVFLWVFVRRRRG